MAKGYLLLVLKPTLAFSLNNLDVEKGTLVWVIIVLLLVLIVVLAFEFRRAMRNRTHKNPFSFLQNVRLEIKLEKDRTFRPQLLTMTIRNTGKREANIEAPVLIYSKIWSKRKFRLNGKNGNQIYPMYIDPGKMHHLRIETSTFHEYDRSIKSYYWAQITVRDVDGRRWKSNVIKLRKSLVT